MRRAELDETRTAEAATRVASGRGLLGRVTLLRSGMNHVFRLGDIVLRVAPEEVGGQMHVELARRLLRAGLPAVPPLGDAVVVDGLVVTIWEHIDQPPEVEIDYEQLGDAIARVHRLGPELLPSQFSVPWVGQADWLQLEAVYERAAATDVVDQDDLAVLAAECQALADWQDRARGEPGVICHGDVHPQNVLMRPDGRIAILDWDSLCVAPAAWDHAPLLTWEQRWGGAPGTYESFASGYGADLRGSSLAQFLARVRLLAPTLNKIVQGADDPERAAEARRRMRYWHGDPHAPPWQPQ